MLDHTFEADHLASKHDGTLSDSPGLLSIGVQPYKQLPTKEPPIVEDATTSDVKPASTMFKRLASAVVSAKAAAVAAARRASVDSTPWFVLSSKVAGDVSIQCNGSGGIDMAQEANLRPRIYHVRRSHDHLVWFRDTISQKQPFLVSRPPLPNRKDAHTREGIDEIVAMLYICASSAQLRDDPLFWSLLTQDDDAFNEQYEQLVASEKDSHQDPKDPAGTAAAAATLQKRIVAQTLQAIHKHHAILNLPVKDLKPPKISDMLMETGVVDRALMTLDKVNTCVGSSFYFEKHVSTCKKQKDALAAWRAAGEAAYALRDALEDDRQASVEVGEALRELAFPSMWPWSRDDMMDDSPTKQQQAAAADQLRPPPSQRLTHYLHRVANTCQELGRLEVRVYGEEFCAAVNTCGCVKCAVVSSADAAHERLHSYRYQPRRGEMTLPSIQKGLLKIMSEGRGHDALDELEEMDRCISEIQEAVDDAVLHFTVHSEDATRAARLRLSNELVTLARGQMYTWQGALLLLADLKTTLDLDIFLDDEPLPFTDAPVLHNPSPLQVRKFEALQEEWGRQISRFFAAEKGAVGDADNTPAIATNKRWTLFSSGNNATYRRTALRESTADEAADAFDEPYEMSEAVAVGVDVTTEPVTSTELNIDRRSVLPEELQRVVEQQQRSSALLLEEADVSGGKAAAGRHSHEFVDHTAKSVSKTHWKERSSPKQRAPGVAGVNTWGSVVEDDESDPFSFEV